MRVAVSGSTGLIGAALAANLRADGHEIVRLVRPSTGTPQPGDARWDPRTGDIDSAALEGTDAVVHLAGETISALRWTADKRRRIRESRVRGTDLLARAIAACRGGPGSSSAPARLATTVTAATKSLMRTASLDRDSCPQSPSNGKPQPDPPRMPGFELRLLAWRR